ncbi:MAG: hypothetical protein Q7J13_10385 [Brevundimonas sp.]|uniref:hypothetical protein n=1 Tax=Brevundimonas sp. TaxID=1871086 RepID=UPI002718F121|nr:hypothetical protein [Brevundimonas sp.]MDO9588328.1 hypothetical protein [Brevundimonas sp.]
MTPTHAYGKRGGAHRYYISSTLNRGKTPKRLDGIYRLPALPTERWVIETLHRLAPDHDPLEVLARMEVHEGAVQLALKVSALSEDERTLPLAVDRIGRQLQDGERIHEKQDAVWVHIPRRLKFRGGRAWLSGEAPKRNRMSQPLVKAVKWAHELLDANADANHVLQQAPPTVHERGLIRLAWLAPDLQMAMLEGRQKPGLCLEDLRFARIPLCWDDQRRMLAG